MKSSSTNSDRPAEAADKSDGNTGSSTGQARRRVRAVGLMLCVYAAWLVALMLLAWNSPRDVVSRGQLAWATVLVRGRVLPDGEGGWQVHVLEILQGPGDGTLPIAPGQRIHVPRLEQVAGWEGVGEYVLPLRAQASGWQIAEVPNSLGLISRMEPRRRIYPASASVLRQIQASQHVRGETR